MREEAGYDRYGRVNRVDKWRLRPERRMMAKLRRICYIAYSKVLHGSLKGNPV